MESVAPSITGLVGNTGLRKELEQTGVKGATFLRWVICLRWPTPEGVDFIGFLSTPPEASVCLGTSARSAIVSNPASIVDHGTYISDTVNHLDWYKFSNPATSVGLSFTAANVIAGAGWHFASLAQVQSLQAQFGWVMDTFDFASGNAGLTAAMASYLGFTGVQSSHPVSSPFLVTTVSSISAMTYDLDPSCICAHLLAPTRARTMCPSQHQSL